MANIKKYNGSTWENTTARKYETKSEIIIPPTTIYADGTAATVSLKGNTVQNGTPSPSNPVDVVGVGERTENLFDGSYTDGYIGGDTGTRYSTSSTAKTAIVKCEPNTTYTIKKITSSNRFTIATSASYPQDSEIVNVLFNSPTETTATITTPADALYLLIYVSTSSEQATPNMMLNTGSTAKPYEPYGYKIPILINGNTTNIYIGDNPLRKSLDGTAYDTLDSDGTLIQRVDSDGSVLATPIVTQITMPTFATIDGANSVSVDTTVQPSEMTMTYTGWHDSSVKEWDGDSWE